MTADLVPGTCTECQTRHLCAARGACWPGAEYIEDPALAAAWAALQELGGALETYRIERGAEPRPTVCLGGRACLEPPRQDDGRVKCATCGHGFKGAP